MNRTTSRLKRSRTALLVAGAVGLAFALIQLVGPKSFGPVERPLLGTEQGIAEPARISPFGDMSKSERLSGLDIGTLENGWLSASRSASDTPSDSPLSTMSAPRFIADPRGQLIVNADTRNNLEKLLLKDAPDAIDAQLKEVSQGLPERATEQLKTLLTHYQQYSTALNQSIPPGDAPTTEQESLGLFERIHALRVAYLGAEAAKAMFGEEEEMTRHVMTLIQNENNPNLTLEQKAARAQEVMSKMPPPKAAATKP